MDKSWGTYPREVVGSSFRVELGFHELRVFLSDRDKPRIIKTEELQRAEAQPDGSTKLAIRFKRDLAVPTSGTESMALVAAVNSLLNERRATELRDKKAAEALRQQLRQRRR